MHARGKRGYCNNALLLLVFVGYARPQGATNSEEYFRGCVKNMKINDTSVEWHEIDRLIDVQVAGCPVP